MVVFDSRINGSWSFVLYIWFSKIFLYLILKKYFYVCLLFIGYRFILRFYFINKFEIRSEI